MFQYMPIVIPLILCFWSIMFLWVVFTLVIPRYILFRNSKYREESGLKFWETATNKGYWGEFRIFRELEKYKGYRRILTNIYLDKGSEKTEIDVVMINSYGIHVFESKNFKGKIYGNEKNKNWVQYLYGKKSNFFNPIKQNQVHINALKETLQLNSPSLYSSYIIFGPACDFQKVSEPPKDVRIEKPHSVLSTILIKQQGMKKLLQIEHIDAIYDRLATFTKVSSEEKQRHIESIKKRIE